MSIIIDVKELRKLTDKAVAEAKAERKEKEEARKARIVAIQKAANDWIAQEIEKVPAAAKRAALLGQSDTCLYDIKGYIDFGRRDVGFDETIRVMNSEIEKIVNPVHGNCVKTDCDKLTQAYFVVGFMTKLKGANLNPSLNYWWDGDGRDSGYKVKIAW